MRAADREDAMDRPNVTVPCQPVARGQPTHAVRDQHRRHPRRHRHHLHGTLNRRAIRRNGAERRLEIERDEGDTLGLTTSKPRIPKSAIRDEPVNEYGWATPT